MAGIPVVQVGCGYWGRNLARNFHALGALAGVVDADPANAAAMATQLGVPVLGLEQALEDPAIRALAFATPAETHAEMARQALAAGKHVYVEKPMALSVAACREMIEAARSAGRVLMVGHLLQYHPVFVRLLGLVASGGLGNLRYLYSNRLSLGRFRVEEDVLWSFGPHDISMILALADRPVRAVTAQGSAFVTPGVADVATCQIAFEGGLRGHVFASWAHPFKEQRLVVIGAEGMAVFEDSHPQWGHKLAVYRHAIDRSGPVPVPAAAPPDYVLVDEGEPLKAECREFLEAIRDGRAPRTDGTEGLAVIDVLERAGAAMQRGP
ncbi:Gfo/Idh/MocA family oxidoreductase (plasmid) [Limimaricola variabilis]|uniref:Gfo/Idh/MocA family protein n=1 Tax=Limimaricola variabilis TaxID=1492771 RepID=UPI002AC9BA13|nr:Gfo/Idh/MocA family oxidoreductase [Limimaricola variabilis]WPY97033.1 Gfo/Idh/MocA family oxidoreductase [Limimaricola variabilis]